MDPRVPRWAGLAILGLIAHITWLKSQAGILDEMLWSCYPAGLAAGVGLLGRVQPLAAVGFVFLAAVGLPAYLLDVAVQRTTTVPSLLLHVITPLAAGLAVRGTPMPRYAPLIGTGAYGVLLGASYYATDPALNVNVAHEPWEFMGRIFSNLWAYWLFNLAVMALILTVACLVIERWWMRGSACMGTKAGIS